MLSSLFCSVEEGEILSHVNWLIVFSNNIPLQIYLTPEGMLSTEQGVYIAEFVTGNNQKQAKGRFRVYENDNGSVNVSMFFMFSIFSFCQL